MTQLGLRGAMLFANVNGEPIHGRKYWPDLRDRGASRRAADDPSHDAAREAAYAEYRLTPLIGFLVDTTLAITHLTFAGVLETFPNLRFVLGHLGGTIPYIAERIDQRLRGVPRVLRTTSRRSRRSTSSATAGSTP